MSSDSSYLSVAHLPFRMKMYSFDAMDQTATVRNYGGSSEAQPLVYSDGKDDSNTKFVKAMAALPTAAWETGKEISDSFRSQWKHEQYSITYYDSQRWYEALAKADSYDWKGAMDIWFEFLDSTDAMKRAWAEYNIAVACYMLGDFDLARQWLDRSVAENDMPTLTDAMRKRIEARKK